jgi:hypothetical protein
MENHSNSQVCDNNSDMANQPPVVASDKVNDELQIQILLNEYNQSNERIESFQNRQDNILQITLLIIGGTIAFTLLNPIAEEFLIIIPTIPLIVFIQIMYHYSRAIANQGYREYLLELINKYLPENSHIKYSYVAKEYLLSKNPSAKINTVLFPLVIVLSILYSVVMSNYNILVIIFNFLIMLFVLLQGPTYFKFLKNLNEETKKFCKTSKH